MSDSRATRLARSLDFLVCRLSEIVAKLGMNERVEPSEEPPISDPLPQWLVTKLVKEARLKRGDVEAMTLEAAFDAWTCFLTEGRPHEV